MTDPRTNKNLSGFIGLCEGDISRNLDLERFGDNLFEMSHCSIFANSEFTGSFREIMLESDNISAVSSAKSLVINLDALGRSSI